MPLIDQFISKHKLHDGFKVTAEQYYIPLAKKIATHQKEANQCYYVGINGCQGSGKSTLAEFLLTYLTQSCDLKVEILSLDDFYLSQQQRKELAARVHPLFATRGVPGTHNTKLMKSVLDDLAKPNFSCAIPRFNKAMDNPIPQDQWPVISTPVDIVIFEGWCWGVDSQTTEQLQADVNTLETNEDPDRIWRRYVNQQLKDNYQPLYDKMNYWIMFKAPSFANVYNWRLEQEQKLAQSLTTNDNSGLMSAAQIQRFIQFYQRLTEHGLASLPTKCHEVFELDPTRKITGHVVQIPEVKR